MGSPVSSRVALVTGASRGIGRAIALELARAGHQVACCASSDGGKETQAEIEADGGTALAVRVDVGDPEAVDAGFAEIEGTWGPVEILVNNAGVTADGLIAKMSDESWGRVIQTNLTGAFHTIRRATPKMMRGRWGRIVNVSSVSGQAGAPGQANYSAAKAGLLGLSRAIARELAPRGITCTAEWRAAMEATVPLGRLGTSEEVAAVVAFLCSEPAGYVTGALVPVDGGLGMGH
jgi:3-oxoacyl-[acyl-carrier protein] reductase